jgi:hypothetical protein
MRRSLLHSILVFLIVGPSFTTAQQVPAQQVKVVRVGVAVEQYLDHETRVNWTSNARSQRDLLLNYLSRHQPDKNNPLKLEAVPITTASYNTINAGARDKGCGYIVVLNLGSAFPSTENPSFHSPENSFQPESGVPPNGLVSYSVGFSLLRASDSVWLGGKTYRQLQPQSTAGMTVMSSVYDAIVKAATP